ncbi:MAG: tRNA preQ1(34) S-adenosylmethionine ribosyltransferase-isomerase QueA [Candidatus Hydrogenedentes bacterium]|nr:tRNA preQ1(34) S-adenosylmethionine ribosyltransferase-isomerase QueA [Candidatus Hydrogenedentota bacterium]
MDISELDYDLPDELIAQHPKENRDESRLLVVDRADGSLREDVFRNVGAHLRAGDCLVLNETRVIRARLHGRKPSGGKVEIFLLHEHEPGAWDALVRPSAKVPPGTTVVLGSGMEAVVEEVLPEGRRRVRFHTPDVLRVLEECGEVPLPPYIHRKGPEDADLTRYQTVYAQAPGAVAAPTAGLHFTDAVFADLERRGVQRTSLTLHVGYGTFSPIRGERVEAHIVEPEEFVFPEATSATLNATRDAGGRVVAVGTTSTRVLEFQYRHGQFQPGAGTTGLYIYPPYTYRAVDVLQTNFHLPKSSLLALVYAFAGIELAREAYRYAIANRFRFYSYGDVMLIL